MNAPDKIYIQTHKGETLSSKWTTIPFRDFENEEYIRKDALLEWLQKKVGVSYGVATEAFVEVIDKLNEM